MLQRLTHASPVAGRWAQHALMLHETPQMCGAAVPYRPVTFACIVRHGCGVHMPPHLAPFPLPSPSCSLLRLASPLINTCPLPRHRSSRQRLWWQARDPTVGRGGPSPRTPPYVSVGQRGSGASRTAHVPAGRAPHAGLGRSQRSVSRARSRAAVNGFASMGTRVRARNAWTAGVRVSPVRNTTRAQSWGWQRCSAS